MQKILFVCLGNICRSPMAEAVFMDQLQNAGLTSEYQVASAATGSWELGSSPHPGTQKILALHGISCEGKRARQISLDDFVTYDWILAMDRSNQADLLAMAPAGTEHKVRLFLSAVCDELSQEVPDPYYTGDFSETYRLVYAGCQKWLEELQN